jgi:hypothetical protein
MEDKDDTLEGLGGIKDEGGTLTSPKKKSKK